MGGRREEPADPLRDGALTIMADQPHLIWQCITCGELYDEAAGLPDFGIPPGTRFADLPEDWICPACGSAKADFMTVEL